MTGQFYCDFNFKENYVSYSFINNAIVYSIRLIIHAVILYAVELMYIPLNSLVQQ